MTAKKKEAPRDCHPETQTETEILEESIFGDAIIANNMVIRLTVPKFGTFMVQEEVGPAGEAILREAIKQIRTVDASTAPLPMEYVFKHDACTVFFGDRFETKRDITQEPATKNVLETMEQYGVSCLAIARYEDYAQVMYGRHEVFEFMKYLPLHKEVA